VVGKYHQNAAEVVSMVVAMETSRMLLEIEKLPSIRLLLDKLSKRS
jgi:hypothetical protein